MEPEKLIDFILRNGGRKVCACKGMVMNNPFLGDATKAQVQLYNSPDKKKAVLVVMDADQLAAVGGLFELAEITLTVYAAGPIRITVVEYAGKSETELLAEPLISLTDAEVRRIDG